MRAPGWYSDPDTGGTKYWDGFRWTGDTRARRRIFAAPAQDRRKGLRGLAVAACGILLSLVTWIGANQVAERPTGWGWFVILGLAVGIVGVAVGTYFLRGQGPTTDAVEARLARERQARADTDRRAAHLVRRAPRPAVTTRAARLGAEADPDKAKALKDLEELLYARKISDSEYQAAKEALSGTGLSAQLAQLAELHREGMLSEVEFAAARLRLLGL